MESSCEEDADTIEYDIEVVQSSSSSSSSSTLSISLASVSSLQTEEVIINQSSNEESCQSETVGDKTKVPVSIECAQLESNKLPPPKELPEKDGPDEVQTCASSSECQLDGACDNQQVEGGEPSEQLQLQPQLERAAETPSPVGVSDLVRAPIELSLAHEEVEEKGEREIKDNELVSDGKQVEKKEEEEAERPKFECTTVEVECQLTTSLEYDYLNDGAGDEEGDDGNESGACESDYNPISIVAELIPIRLAVEVLGKQVDEIVSALKPAETGELKAEPTNEADASNELKQQQQQLQQSTVDILETDFNPHELFSEKEASQLVNDLNCVLVRDQVQSVPIEGEPNEEGLNVEANLPAADYGRLPFFVGEEDLELEFDNEAPFEGRQVEVIRGQDPRSHFELGEELGRGKFGTVFRCAESASGRKLAAKFVLMRRPEDRADVEREVAIMSQLQHKRLLQLYAAYDDGLQEMCLITELIEGGELFARIVDNDFDLTEKKAAIFMRQTCEGVEYMHGQNIVHLDLKPENILCVSKTGNRIKLIDFGLARQLDEQQPLRVMFGTPDFAAPEVLSYDIVSLATDMWSVGVICYVLLSGLSPFMGDSDMDTMANVTRATYDFDDAAFEPISELAKDFIAKLLVREQENRLRPSECLQHPWLQRGGRKLEECLQSRRQSMALIAQGSSPNLDQLAGLNWETGSVMGATPPLTPSLDKRNLKKYVVRRKWHKTVHAIMALGRMGANLRSRLT